MYQKRGSAQRQLSLELEHPKSHFASLHEAAHGTVLVWERAVGEGRSRWIRLKPNDPLVPSCLDSLRGRKGTFTTPNEFAGWRLVRLLRSLRALYVDLDGCTELDVLVSELKRLRLPAPSLVVFSGRGLHPYWLLRPTPAQSLPVWQRVEDALVDGLSGIGADPVARDCTRMLRLVGSRNEKNDALVRGLVLTGKHWTLREMADKVLGRRKRGKPSAGRKAETLDLRRRDCDRA